MVKRISAIALLFALFFSDCTWAAQAKPLVLVSIAPQKQIVERLAGDFIEVLVIIPATANPHVFEPTLTQAKAINRASLFLQIGHPELFFEQAIVEKFASTYSFKIVDTAKGIPLLADDPHVWTSPRAMLVMLKNSANALMELLPEKKQAIEANLIQLEEQVSALDRDLKILFLNDQGKSFFVFHPAWGYFAKDYGLIQVALEAHGKEPGTQHVMHVSDQAKLRGAKVLFTQLQTSSIAAQTFTEDLHIKLEMLNPMEEDWFSNIRQSAEKIKNAL
ncbi:MAG: zinc ABC transporter substrate-binding protein [Deltaproteobacteria bacterium]|nr:zinc ABC transporter substrate-binding protein [Deltaproteobacteria bacterium]